MTSTFSNKSEDIAVDVHVNNVTGTEIASKLSGYFVIGGNRTFRFKALAFGRIGGHNISLSVSKKTLADISKMGLDPELVELKVQRKLVEGDISIEVSNKQENKTQLDKGAF
jgi:hypothetical protein